MSKTASSIKSLVKVTLQSRPTGLKPQRRVRPLIVLANGPSLNDTMRDSLSALECNDCASVNFAPLSEMFFKIKPKYHFMADPLFFSQEAPFNVKQLFEALARVDWDLTLFVPCRFAGKLPEGVRANMKIKVQKFNFVGAEGFGWMEKLLYNHKLAMPRPRNVLIPALMGGIWLGYKEIYIVGADHSWMRTISVDDDNNVISIQPHFYKEDEREQKRVDTAYKNYRLHQIVHSFYVAFRSYHVLERYAQKKGVEIYNSTPGSYIDAFKRRPLP